MADNKQLLEDAKFLDNSGALAKVFENGDTLRQIDMYGRLVDLVRNYIPEERVNTCIDYLQKQGVFRTSGQYAVYQPLK